jgi:4,5-dihydroxyphthalate decarboxylase
VKRLFADVRSVEAAYFKKTGIFPIMHVMAIRRELAKAHPELPRTVFRAFCQARDLDYEESRRIRWAYSSLPWYGQEFDRTRELMGENFYSCGIKDNRKALESALRYLHQQGLTKRELTIKEMFEESTLELADIEAD